MVCFIKKAFFKISNVHLVQFRQIFKNSLSSAETNAIRNKESSSSVQSSVASIHAVLDG